MDPWIRDVGDLFLDLITTTRHVYVMYTPSGVSLSGVLRVLVRRNWLSANWTDSTDTLWSVVVYYVGTSAHYTMYSCTQCTMYSVQLYIV